MDIAIPCKIGVLAKASGLTVRTLHHWDAIGLLSPSGRSAAGHREYSADDIRRLYKILALRQVGLELHTIGTCLDADVDVRRVIADHRTVVERSIATMNALLDRLRRIEVEVASGDSPSVESVIEAIKAIDCARVHRDVLLRDYLDEEQLSALQSAAATIGPVAYSYLLDVEWPQLYVKVDALRVAGADPTAPEVQRVVERMDGLSTMFNGGNTTASQAVRAAWRDDPGAMSGYPRAPTSWRDLADFVDAARAHLSTRVESTNPSGKRVR